VLLLLLHGGRLCMQISGIVIATVGFVLATRLFGVPFQFVAFGHGQLGVAILVLVWSQVRSDRSLSMQLVQLYCLASPGAPIANQPLPMTNWMSDRQQPDR
jgi:hypothetical protein